MEVDVKKLFSELAEIEEIEAIALGGSRADEHFDQKSDYDLYVYCQKTVSEEKRREILSRYCVEMEIGNHFWEYEDNCTLKNGIDIDIIYRNLGDFVRDVESVVEGFNARNGYTTCMWHNLLHCRIIADKTGKLNAAKTRFSVPYPPQLKQNIIERNMCLLSSSLPAYRTQIAKASARGDRNSILHRTSAFLESYFDIIFALNELTHPGEKRLVSLCKSQCKILPADFEKNLKALFDSVSKENGEVVSAAEKIINELKKVL